MLVPALYNKSGCLVANATKFVDFWQVKVTYIERIRSKRSLQVAQKVTGKFVSRYRYFATTQQKY